MATGLQEYGGHAAMQVNHRESAANLLDFWAVPFKIYRMGQVLWMFFSPVLLEDGRRRGRTNHFQDATEFNRAGTPACVLFYNIRCHCGWLHRHLSWTPWWLGCSWEGRTKRGNRSMESAPSTVDFSEDLILIYILNLSVLYRNGILKHIV